jgi:hypothetical protein
MKLNYDHKALASVTITIINVMPQFGVYLTIVIYNRQTFMVQATCGSMALGYIL